MKKIIIIISAIMITGCKDARQAQWDALGKAHIIKQYSGGCLINTWESTGSVSNEDDGSDGWYFEDAATGKLIECTGTISIEVK